MAVQAAGATLPIHHYLTEAPQDNATSLGRKALLYDVITKISWIALAALMTTVLYIGYSSITLTATGSLILAGMVISSVFFAWGVSKFQTTSDHYYRLSKEEAAVANQLKKIEHWSSAQVQQFLQDQGLNPAAIPLDRLREVNPTEPFKALLPLIAKYLHIKASAENLEQRSTDALAVRMDDAYFAQIEANTGKEMSSQKRREHRLYSLRPAYAAHERAAQIAVYGALILQLIQEPVNNWYSGEKRWDFTAIGDVWFKNFEERMLSRTFQPVEDNFFVFAPGYNRAPITLRQVEADQNPARLRQLIFPNAVV